LRDRLIDACRQRGHELPRCGAAVWSWRIDGGEVAATLPRVRRANPVGAGGHRPSALKPHKAFLDAVRAETPDITLEALSTRLLAERGVKADTSMLSRFFRREGITRKKRRSLRANATAPTSAATGRAGANISSRSIPPASSSSTRPGPKPT